MSYLKIFVVLLVLLKSVSFSSEIRIGITSVPLNLSPLYATDANSQNINRVSHLALIDFDENMRARCDACSAYEEQIDKKGNHHIDFVLKRGLYFWDGTGVRAGNLKKSLTVFLDEKRKSNHARAFSNIKEIKILDNFKLRVIFKKYALENMNNLTLLKIIKLDGEKILGCGPYKIEKKTPLQVTLTPSRDKNKPKLVFKVVKDETTLALKIVNNEIHLSLGGISPRKYDWLKKNTKNYNFLEIPGTNYKYISFNHKNEHLSKLGVRKAISMLIPRKELLKYKLHNTAVLSRGLFSPSFSKFYVNSQNIEFNQKKAAELFKSLGYLKNKGKWTLNNTPLSFEWRVSNNKATIEIVNLIKDYITDFGIDIKVSVQEWGTFMKNVKKGNFDLIMGQWIGFTGPDMMKFIWHSESIPPGGANRGHYINPGFDEIVNKATNELDENLRNSLYKEAQSLAENDFAYLGMWHPNITWIQRKCVKGVKIYPNGGFLGLRDLKLVCKQDE